MCSVEVVLVTRKDKGKQLLKADCRLAAESSGFFFQGIFWTGKQPPKTRF